MYTRAAKPRHDAEGVAEKGQHFVLHLNGDGAGLGL